MIRTTAIVATDYYGYISHSGVPVGFRALNRSVRSLDQSFLRSTLTNLMHQSNHPLVVMGETSWKAIQGTKLFDCIPSTTHICTAGQEGVTLGDRFNPHVESDTLAEARRKIYGYALDKGVDQIIVLGGKSVHRAFQYHYSEVYHAIIKAGIGKGDDKQWIIPCTENVDVLYDDADIRFQRLFSED